MVSKGDRLPNPEWVEVILHNPIKRFHNTRRHCNRSKMVKSIGFAYRNEIHQKAEKLEELCKNKTEYVCQLISYFLRICSETFPSGPELFPSFTLQMIPKPSERCSAPMTESSSLKSQAHKTVTTDLLLRDRRRFGCIPIKDLTPFLARQC